MNLRVLELQKLEKKTLKIRSKNLDGQIKIDKVFYYQKLAFILKIIKTKLISQYYNNKLAKYFSFDKTKYIIGWKNY